MGNHQVIFWGQGKASSACASGDGEWKLSKYPRCDSNARP
jgi:hypothetical protein